MAGRPVASDGFVSPVPGVCSWAWVAVAVPLPVPARLTVSVERTLKLALLVALPPDVVILIVPLVAPSGTYAVR